MTKTQKKRDKMTKGEEPQQQQQQQAQTLTWNSW